ncbi:hypothetical protein L2E82_05008 [Cichorium intybus]|uniref:Uncharacterized protein n=1 Tax=Cichorium intybus TaxID=13427 RepID=A0ACB9H806_CICIN|nr:hypothetical protein L2E82_05008 [Cichorium intybus]
MEEQFVLRVPPSVAERIDRLLNESASSSHDQSLDLSFSEDGRSGTFVIGDDHFPASLLDLPSIVESYKTYDDNVLIKTADVGQMIMVREEGDPTPEGMEYRHGVTPPMRDARRRSSNDLSKEYNVFFDMRFVSHMDMTEQDEVGEGSARNTTKKAVATPAAKPDVSEAGTNAGEPERSDSDESDYSI